MHCVISQPNSYSGEDMCEFHVHGSPAIVSKLLQVLGEMPGLRPADAGEFTKRAVLNDKMNVLQAEALDCLIWSKTESQRKQALETLISDRIKAKYEKWADQLLRFVAYMEAYVEFGEDQLLDQERIQLQLSKLQELCAEIDRHLFSSAQKSDLIQNGLKVAIIGQPNVGKSSLLNQLCRFYQCLFISYFILGVQLVYICFSMFQSTGERELAIVSPISGTTRDVIEAQLNLDGYAVTLCDTAGIRAESRDPIEQEGINRARLR